jgi:hypothetical protein
LNFAFGKLYLILEMSDERNTPRGIQRGENFKDKESDQKNRKLLQSQKQMNASPFSFLSGIAGSAFP